MQYLPNKTAGDVSDQDINNCINISSVVNKKNIYHNQQLAPRGRIIYTGLLKEMQGKYSS